MKIIHNNRTDLLYIRLDDRIQNIVNQKITEDITLSIGEEDKLVGIDILDASKHLTLDKLLPIAFENSKGS